MNGDSRLKFYRYSYWNFSFFLKFLCERKESAISGNRLNKSDWYLFNSLQDKISSCLEKKKDLSLSLVEVRLLYYIFEWRKEEAIRYKNRRLQNDTWKLLLYMIESLKSALQYYGRKDIYDERYLP